MLCRPYSWPRRRSGRYCTDLWIVNLQALYSKARPCIRPQLAEMLASSSACSSSTTSARAREALWRGRRRTAAFGCVAIGLLLLVMVLRNGRSSLALVYYVVLPSIQLLLDGVQTPCQTRARIGLDSHGRTATVRNRSLSTRARQPQSVAVVKVCYTGVSGWKFHLYVYVCVVSV